MPYADDDTIARRQAIFDAQTEQRLAHPGLGGETGVERLAAQRVIDNDAVGSLSDAIFIGRAVTLGLLDNLMMIYLLVAAVYAVYGFKQGRILPIALAASTVWPMFLLQALLENTGIKKKDNPQTLDACNKTEPEQPAESDSFFLDMQRLLSFSLPWSERTTLEKSYTVIFAFILIALLPMPYGFYDGLRVIICIGLYFFFQAILPERENRRGWFILIIGLFALYNPIVPVHIGEKVIWTLINAATLYALYRARLIFDTAKTSA